MSYVSSSTTHLYSFPRATKAQRKSAGDDGKGPFVLSIVPCQRAKKVVSNSPGLVDFAIGLVNFFLNLPDRQVKFFDEFKLQKNCEIISAHQNVFGASCSLPEWQALKMTFFAPCLRTSFFFFVPVVFLGSIAFNTLPVSFVLRLL